MYSKVSDRIVCYRTKLVSVVGSDSAIRKAKKAKKIKKFPSNSEVAAVVKEEFVESRCKEILCKQIPSRQQIWNQYLKTFYEIEKLNQDQKQIMEFCLNKSLTPPKRKRRFLVIVSRSIPIPISFVSYGSCSLGTS